MDVMAGGGNGVGGGIIEGATEMTRLTGVPAYVISITVASRRRGRRRPAADASTASPLKCCRVARDASMASRKCHGPGKQDFVLPLACAVARL